MTGAVGRRVPARRSPPPRLARVTAAATRRAAYAHPGSLYYASMLAMMTVVVVLSGIGGSKGVVFGPIITDGGFFLFPLAYILGDVITEIYGARAARRAILAGFLANVLAVVTYAIIIVLPGFDDEYGVAKQAALETALGPVWQIVLASALGFLAGQSTNSFIMWAAKKRQLERGLYARMIGSTGVGELLDTVVFCTVAATAIGITTLGQWANYTIFGFLYKVAVQYAALPLTAWAIGVIKRREPTYQAALAASAVAAGAEASPAAGPATGRRAASGAPGAAAVAAVDRGEVDLSVLLADLSPALRPTPVVYAVADEVPPGTAVFATVREREGLTLVLDQDEAERAGLAYDHVAAMITLTVHSSLEAVGLTAAVSRVLAAAGISCNVIAGAHHDHLLVPWDRREDALAALHALQLQPTPGGPGIR